MLPYTLYYTLYMNIAINTRLLLKDKLEGIGWFSYETLRRITKQHPEHHFIFLFDRKYSDEFIFSDNITPVVIPPPSRHPFLWYIWFEMSVPPTLSKYKADLFLSPDGYLSLASNVPSIPVIHDLNFMHYPKDLPYLYSQYYRHFFPKYARKAKRIATVSEYSKNDIVTQFGIDEHKIDVVYNGANENFAPLSPTLQHETRLKYSGGAPYFIFVGALHPRKNIANLFRAFDAFRKTKDSNVKLLIVGQKKWWTDEIREAFESMEYKNEVIFTGRLSEEELIMVMAAALAMVYVSYFEGFGIPIIEAMRCSVPVITSDITSMPEIAGDAALLVNPFSVESISEAMLKISFDEGLRNDLINKGSKKSQDYNWDRTADLLWKCISKEL